jgi:large subunit ribosomal protein L18
MANHVARKRRRQGTRHRIRELSMPRLCIHRTPRHIYAQIINGKGDKVLSSASTLDKEVREKLAGVVGNMAAAKCVGEFIAQRAKQAGVERVAFDRSGFKYHGRIKALAEAARESGLII